MKIYCSSDHAGFALKQHIVHYLESAGFEIIDLGPKIFDKNDDYPDFISLTAREVSKNPTEAKGIVIGLSGQGEAMVANKFPNVRAGVFYGGSNEIISLLRQHNDANILSLGAKYVTSDEAEHIIDLWLGTEFSNESRHARRIEKIILLEKKNGLRV